MKPVAVWLSALLLVAVAGLAQAGPASNALSWRVADEKAVFGYIIYRSDRREGPFRRINPQIVRSRREQVDAGRYSFEDRAVEAGKSYYYFIDVISLQGRKQRLSGVRSKTATERPSSP